MICEICFGAGWIDGYGYCGCSAGKEYQETTKVDMKMVAEKLKGKTVVLKVPTKPPFKVGDWVWVKGGHKNNPDIIRGYVLKNDKYAEKSFIQAVWNNMNMINNCSWVNWDSLIKMQQETDPNILIDLALATRDEEWFTQLTRGME